MKEKQVKKCTFSPCAQLTYVSIKAEVQVMYAYSLKQFTEL